MDPTSSLDRLRQKNPDKITDEALLKQFFYSLSDRSMYTRFMSARVDMPHEKLQEYTVIDYTKEMVILAVVEHAGADQVVGLADNRPMLRVFEKLTLPMEKQLGDGIYELRIALK